MKEQIEKEIENMGYNIKKIEIQIETKDEETYGNIKDIEIVICKDNIKTKNVNQIKISNIEIRKSNNIVNENTVGEEDSNKIKEFLYNNYKIKEKDICINFQI